MRADRMVARDADVGASVSGDPVAFDLDKGADVVSDPFARRRFTSTVIGDFRREWPTWLVLAACYVAWIGALAFHEILGPIGFALIGGYAIALHASLQHEALHGHPTRSAALNEALVFPTLNLLMPYRRFKEMHLRHHCDERLTDPFDDPESWYLAEGDWRNASPFMRVVLRVNATLGGRLLIGPWLSAFGVWRCDLGALCNPSTPAARKAKLVDAYLRHGVAIALVLGVVWGVFGMHPVAYLLFGAWPGFALLMLRTYAEHRAASDPSQRSAIVEAEPIFGLLFLNNNLHAVHHARPTEPWHRLPAIWRTERARVLARNGGYYIPSYRAVLAQWLFRRREPIAHPFMRRDDCEETRANASAQDRDA